jgi:hypothetical protein
MSEPNPSAPSPNPPAPGTAPWNGARYLGADWSAPREQLTMALNIAYRGLSQVRAENYALWVRAIKMAETTVKQWFQAVGLEAPPFHEDSFARRIAPLTPVADHAKHVALVNAVMTDYSARFAEQFAYRLRTSANVHLEITGPTGMAKSSCAISIADWCKRIEPGTLLRHMNFDLPELADRFADKEPGDSVIQDEFLEQTGEGAVNAQKMFMNVEDTLRASQIHFIVCSPRKREHATMQATLEAVAWNRRAKWTAFLVWMNGEPHGLLPVPWCRADLWAEYSAFKARNVDRTKNAAFRDRQHTARTAMRLFEDEWILDHLINVVTSKKKKRADFEEAIELYRGDMMTTAQRTRIAGFMFNAARGFHRIEATFEARFGVPINDGLRAVAEAMRVKTRDEEAEE